jgi:hypothetical protein
MTLLDQITNLADSLTEPHAHREPYQIWDHNRHRKTMHHITVQHGLLTQLYRAVLPTQLATEGTGGSTPKSRPPLELEALSRHHQITVATARWCRDLAVDTRATTESNIRALVGAAGHLDEPDQRALAADLRRWTHWCRVYLGLEQVRQITGARCPIPDCNTLSSLRINLTTSHALCTSCEATWGTTTIGLLAQHITTTRTTRLTSTDLTITTTPAIICRM